MGPGSLIGGRYRTGLAWVLEQGGIMMRNVDKMAPSYIMMELEWEEEETGNMIWLVFELRDIRIEGDGHCH